MGIMLQVGRHKVTNGWSCFDRREQCCGLAFFRFFLRISRGKNKAGLESDRVGCIIRYIPCVRQDNHW